MTFHRTFHTVRMSSSSVCFSTAAERRKVSEFEFSFSGRNIFHSVSLPLLSNLNLGILRMLPEKDKIDSQGQAVKRKKRSRQNDYKTSSNEPHPSTSSQYHRKSAKLASYQSNYLPLTPCPGKSTATSVLSSCDRLLILGNGADLSLSLSLS